MKAGTASLLGVFLLLASGCSGGADAQPTTLPPLSSAASPSSTAPTVPVAARAKTAQGADAFVRFFFQQLNVAFRNSDAELIRAYSNSECTTCDSYARALVASRRAGHFLRGDSFVVADVAAPPLQALGTLVEVFGSTPARDQVDASGHVLQTFAATGQFHLTVAVKRTRDGWLVSGIRDGSK